MLERIKPLDALVNRMLDQLPDTVWTSSHTTFLDPAMGGGQFVAAVERRLAAHGHDAHNIASRVFGHEENSFLIDLAKNMYKLVGSYTKRSYHDYLSDATPATYDVILCGPPFQDNSKNMKGNLWSQFIMQAYEQVADGGHIAMITPISWMSGTDDNGNTKKKALHAIFSESSLLHLDLDVGAHFPNVGSRFCSFVLGKYSAETLTAITSNGRESHISLRGFTILPTDLNETSYSIVNKFISYPRKRPFTSTGCVGHPKPLGKGQFTIHNTSASKASSDIEPRNARTRKVVVSVPGYPRPEYDDGVLGCSINSYWMPVSDAEAARPYIAAFDTKLIKFVMESCKYSGFNNILLLKGFPELPEQVDDHSLYAHFNLTAEEIEYVERSTKGG